jgi:hypothetical protein
MNVDNPIDTKRLKDQLLSIQDLPKLEGSPKWAGDMPLHRNRPFEASGGGGGESCLLLLKSPWRIAVATLASKESLRRFKQECVGNHDASMRCFCKVFMNMNQVR